MPTGDMRALAGLAGAAALALAAIACPPAAAGGRQNPEGFGMYTPDDPKLGTYRYDPRSWYYRQPRYYPFYASSYWVPRAEMRYRHRYNYHGPQYRYHPAWGYPRPEHSNPDARWDW